MSRRGWVGVAVFLVGLVWACSGTYTIVFKDTPYCPGSDTAKKLADSIPVMCYYVDTTRTP